MPDNGSRLRAPLSSLLGRGAELERLQQLLVQGRRLITLLGPAGVGKTRLALAFATAQPTRVRFTGGIWFCDLAQAVSLDALCRSVATAVGLGSFDSEAHGGADLVGALGAYFARVGAALLILDNAEQAADGIVRVVGEWLADASLLRCLVTSRERLCLTGETSYELEPLAQADALALFVQRAVEARAGFALHGREHDEAGEIVRRLDGVPLAVELAAAETVVLGPGELLARLRAGRLPLDAGFRDAPARHGSLRAAIDASWQRLSAHERDALAQCAVFSAGFSLRAAEAVVELSAAQEPALLGVLRQLCDRSLLQRDGAAGGGGQGRFVLLATVHAFAREQLAARSDVAQVQARHARYYVALEPEVERPEHARANLQAVVERGLDLAGTGVTLGDALHALSALSDDASEPGELLPPLDRALAAVDAGAPVPPELACRARLARARLRQRDGQHAAALDDYRAVLAAADPASLAPAHCGVGHVQREQGEHAHAQRAYRRALALYTAQGDREGQAKLLANLGGLAHERGEIAAARRLHERALALYRELGNARGAAVVLHNTGLIIQEQGALPEAQATFEEAYRLHVAHGHRRFEGIAHFDLAGLFFESELPAQARAQADAALQLLHAVGDRRLAALTRAIRGACCAALGQLDEARSELERADAELAAIEDRTFAQVAAVHRGHLELALALRAFAAGADLQHQSLLAAAKARTGRSRPRSAPARGCDELRLAARILRAAVLRHARLGRGLLVASDGAWLRAPGKPRANLAPKKVLRRLVNALVERRLTTPAVPLSRSELVHAGWPGERVAGAAASNRLQVALAQLRKLGLERTLLRRGDGYQLDPQVALHVIG